MRVLGIDQSLTGTGISIIDNDGIGESICHQEEIATKEKGTKRLFLIKSKIKEILKEYKPDYVCREDYAYGSKGRSVFNLGELGGVVDVLTYEHDYNIYKIPIMTWKKCLLGKGNVAKDTKYLLKFYKETQIMFDTDNIADSYGLANTLVKYINLKNDPNKIYNMWDYEQEAFFNDKKAKVDGFTFKKSLKEKVTHKYIQEF
jgi:Holliday junction resolvasome RuvABC endonuclease subunit